jgi:ATP-dependent RNA helicase RhlE
LKITPLPQRSNGAWKQQGLKNLRIFQFKAIPAVMKGEDVLAIAQTGTGKTAAFAIPVIDKLHKQKSSSRSEGIKCVVMVPTRELAIQIAEVFTSISKYTKVKTFSVFGGVEQGPQIAKLEKGIDVLVSTPGRMFDLVSQGHIKLERVDTLILDEADHMLDLGFIKDIQGPDQTFAEKKANAVLLGDDR